MKDNTLPLMNIDYSELQKPREYIFDVICKDSNDSIIIHTKTVIAKKLEDAREAIRKEISFGSVVLNSGTIIPIYRIISIENE